MLVNINFIRSIKAANWPVTILSTFKAIAPLSKACRLNTPQNVPAKGKYTAIL